MFTSKPADTRSPAIPVLAEDIARSSESFGRRPFLLKHNLASSDLFQLPRLEVLARTIHAAKNAGRNKDAQLRPMKFAPTDGPRGAEWNRKFSLDFSECEWDAQFGQFFSEIASETSRSWLMLSSANEVDPAYDEVIQQAITEVAFHFGQPLNEITWYGLSIVVTSPGVVTPYHNDHEQNFLLQIRGGKDVWLYDQEDSLVLPQETIENFYSGNVVAARYREELEGHGTIYHIEPGVGVHIPLLAPHSLKIGNELSISVSIAFDTRSMDDLGHVHQANWFLRGMGFKPPRPDLSRSADRLKAGLFRCLSGPRDSHAALFRGPARIKWPAKCAKDVLARLGAGTSAAG